MKQEQYKFEKVLGTGAFGVTYLARGGDGPGRVAVKKSFQQTENFIEKMKNISSKKIPGFVEIYDYFQEDHSDFLVMEYLPGGTLREYIQKNTLKRSDYKAVLRMLYPVMEALAVLHSYGMMHLDISPDNIMLDDQNQCRLIDFGTVRFRDSVIEERPLKEGYGAPELYSNPKMAGPWTDIYSFCALLYELFTGQKVPPAPSRIKKDTLEPLSGYLRLPAAAEAAIHRGLESEIQKRFFSMENLMQRLGLSVEKIQPYAPEVRKEWSSRWIEISARGHFFSGEPVSKRKLIFLKLRRIAIVALAVLTIFSGGRQVIYSVHPEWIFAVRLKAARAYSRISQNSETDEYILSSLSPDYEEKLEFLESHGLPDENYSGIQNSETIYYTLSEADYLSWNCRSNFCRKMYLNWKTLKDIFTCYLKLDKLKGSGETNEEQAWNGAVSVSGAYPGEISIRCYKEQSFSFTDTGNDYKFTFIYDPQDNRTCSVSCQTADREAVRKVLTDILPWCCPETVLTETEAEELLDQCEKDDLETVNLCLNEKAWISLSSFSYDSDTLTYTLQISASRSGVLI